jgi:nitrogen PTS system EIIA component
MTLAVSEEMMNASCSVRSPIRLAELFPPEAILVGLSCGTKRAVIEGLVRHAVSLGSVPRGAEAELVASVLDRETKGSTALGNGVAFPHCRSPHVERFVGVAGFFWPGVPFDAVDAEPVDNVFLVLAPMAPKEQFADALGRLLLVGQDKRLRRFLSGCRTAQRITSFLSEVDQSQLTRRHHLGQTPP